MKSHLHSLVLAFCLLTSFSFSANATLINYDFSAVYHDGSTTAGDFNYNTETETFSDVLIGLTGGSKWVDQVFTLVHFTSDRALVLLDPADGPDYATDTVFHIILQDGGKWGELNPTKIYSDLGECDKSHCPARRNLDVATSAYLTGTVVDVPEPEAIFLFGLALLGLAKRRKV